MNALKKLASSNTLEGISQLIAQFYGGERKELREISPGVWQVISAGEPLSTIVTLRRGRYVFGAPIK